MTDSQFVGARLELARSFERFTLKQLADKVSASAGLLSQYENGLKKQPGGDLVAALAQALRVRPQFFFEPLSDIWAEQECSFRRRVATPERLKKRARAHGTYIGLVVGQLARHLKFPAYNVPMVSVSAPPDVERAADLCRDHWNLERRPISQVGRVAEANGIVLVQHLEHTEKIDAFSRRGAFSVIVLNTKRTSTSRWIFDIAHELAHFVLHGGLTTGTKETERQADMFASAFLLPRVTFGREFASRPFSWTHVFDLKQRWRTSASAIIRRAYDLGLLDPISYRRCYQHMSVQGWLKGEPHEPPFVGPEWLPSAVTLASKRFGLDGGALCQQLHVTPDLLSDIAGIVTEAEAPVFKPRLVKG